MLYIFLEYNFKWHPHSLVFVFFLFFFSSIVLLFWVEFGGDIKVVVSAELSERCELMSIGTLRLKSRYGSRMYGMQICNLNLQTQRMSVMHLD